MLTMLYSPATFYLQIDIQIDLDSSLQISAIPCTKHVNQRHGQRITALWSEYAVRNTNFTQTDSCFNRYHAPEMVHLSEFSDKVDSWAVGVIFYQLLVGEHPFTGCDKSTLEKRIVTCGIELSSTVFENISRPCK